MSYSYPSNSTVEINLFGGGGAYGECILCHLGYGKWIVIDSAKDPFSNKPLIHNYFDSIGENLNKIDLIVTTHWHDDHIKGVSQLYKEANCKLVISQALNKDQLALLIGLDRGKTSSNTSLYELDEIVKHSNNTKNPIVRAIQDRIIYKNQISDINVNIYSLSPSDASIHTFEMEMREIINEAYDLNLAVRKNNPNHSSVVILIEINENKILLGADLQVVLDDNMGWKGVLKSSTVPKNNSVQIFKIPHHGSANGHHDGIWTSVISMKNMFSILSTYCRGSNKLPEIDDISRILKFCDNSFITSNGFPHPRIKKRDFRTNKMLKEFGYVIRERMFEYGHIQLRKDISELDSEWTTELYGNACHLKNFRKSI